MTSGAQSWLLDTGIIVHVMRGSSLGRHLVDDQQLRGRAEAPLISVVSIGELLSLSRQLDWGRKKVEYLREVLSELIVVDINSELVLSTYSEIDFWCHQNGFKLGKNDLWIAATAAVTNSLLLTIDKDFDPLHDRFLQRAYYEPG